jgi:hypothetical protein
VINPIDVIFREQRDNEDRIYSNIEIQNKNRESILFKVKTTDPSAYIVRPNQGIITPEGSTSIKIQCLLDIKQVRIKFLITPFRTWRKFSEASSLCNWRQQKTFLGPLIN